MASWIQMASKYPDTYAGWFDFANDVAPVIEEQVGLPIPDWAKRDAALSAMANKGRAAKLEAFITSLRRYETEEQIVNLQGLS